MKERLFVFYCLLAVMLVLCGVTLCGCDSYYTAVNTFYEVFGTNLDIALIINDADMEAAYEAMDGAVELLRGLESKISSNELRYKNSYINEFNALSCGEHIEIDYETAELIGLCKELYEATDGYFDPTVYYLVEYWGFGNYGVDIGIKRVSNSDDTECIKGLLETVNFRGVGLTEVDGKYYLEKTAQAVAYNGNELELRLDLGGIGKGYATEKARAYLESLGYTDGYISLGGSSIYIMGNPTDKDGKIKVNLVNPRSSVTGRNYYGEIYMSRDGIASSGDYERFFIENGERYCHIINPKTGFPSRSGTIMATVSGSSAVGDAVATALVMMSREEIREFTVGDWFKANITGYSVVYEGEGYTVETSFDLKITDNSFLLLK